jgi:seryl-tRNA synthetase
MAVSEQLTKLADELTKLAARAQEAESRATAASGKAKADLEDDIDSTRASAQAQADKLRARAEESRGNISAWWADMQKSWDAHVAELHDRVETKKAERDVHVAQRRAENAEADAAFAADFAYGAVVEAEYAVLDAVLARTEADELT